MRTVGDTALSEGEEREIRRLSNALACGQAEFLESEGRLWRATAAEVREAMAPYQAGLVPLPFHGFDLADLTQWGPSGEAFILSLPFWTAHGRSDLVADFMIRRRDGASAIGLWDVLAP